LRLTVAAAATRGYGDEVFRLSGSMSVRGGAVLIRTSNRDAADRRVAADPFVEHGMVTHR